jgi:hypothetical protein
MLGNHNAFVHIVGTGVRDVQAWKKRMVNGIIS